VTKDQTKNDDSRKDERLLIHSDFGNTILLQHSNSEKNVRNNCTIYGKMFRVSTWMCCCCWVLVPKT